MTLIPSLARVQGSLGAGRYSLHGPLDHMSLLSTEAELRAGFNNPSYAEREEYKQAIALRARVGNVITRNAVKYPGRLEIIYLASTLSSEASSRKIMKTYRHYKKLLRKR